MGQSLIASAGVLGALILFAGSSAAATCAPSSADPVDAARRMYSGLMAGDRATTLSAFDQEAFLYDGGRRFAPEALTDLILKMERGGAKLQWRIEDAEFHSACDLAWGAWTTRGIFATAAGAQAKTWLESAVFVWRGGAWKVRFFHSTPVLAPK